MKRPKTTPDVIDVVFSPDDSAYYLHAYWLADALNLVSVRFFRDRAQAEVAKRDWHRLRWT